MSDKFFAAVMQRIDSLPQRKVIPDEVAIRWAQGVIKLDPDRALWHVDRARGIGGCENGELLLERNGEPQYLNSADKIIRGKLLLELPDKEYLHMARGTALESLAQNLFHKLMGTTSKLGSTDIQETFKKSGIHPFVVGNPDDVAVRSDGSLLLPDFKVRSNLDWSTKLNIVNVAQVHWYGHILRHNSTEQRPMRYALAELDIPGRMADELMYKLDSSNTTAEEKQALIEEAAETIAKLNMPGFGMRITSFDRNEQLEADLLETAKWFWENHVLTGVPYVKPGTTLQEEVPPEVRKDMHRHLSDFLKGKIGAKVGESESKKAQQAALALMQKYNFSNWPFETPGLTYSQAKKLDTEAAAFALIAKGVPAHELRKHDAEKLDLTKAEAVLRAHGLLDQNLYQPSWDQAAIKKALKADTELNPEQFEKVQVRTALSTKKADQEPLETLSHAMKVHLYRFDPVNSSASDDLDDEADDLLNEGGLSLA